jgi:hypothetical protein
MVYLNSGMHCGTCGLSLDSVDETQIESHGRYSKPKYFCESHKPLQFILL